MSNLIPGQYVTVPASGTFPALIRWATKAPVAHAFLYVGPQTDGTDMVEAQPAGVRKWYSDHYATQYWGMAPEATVGLKIAQTALGLANKDTDYNFLDDFYLGLRDGLRAKVPSFLFRWASTSKHEECAQLVDYCYLQNELHLFSDGRVPGSVTPGDLWRLNPNDLHTS